MTRHDPPEQPAKQAPRRPNGGSKLFLYLLVIVTLVVVGFGLWPTKKPTPDSGAKQDQVQEVDLVDSVELKPLPVIFAADEPAPVINPGYVGPHACAECHAEQYQTMTHSAHFRTCRVPEVDKMPAAFQSDRNRFVSRFEGLHFEMTRERDSFLETAVSEMHERRGRTESTIDLIYGAGMADEVYLAWHADDDTLWELPVAWISNLDEWGCSHFDEHVGGAFARRLTLRCFECHNTWFEHVPGSANQYRRNDFIMGVTCERCHGPGREHVAFHHEHPQSTTTQAIVHPAHLTRDRQTEVCTQCHGNSMTHRGPALAYRPGEPLANHYRELIDLDSEEDHVANQIGYLRQSQCYLQSDVLTCITCHDPHHLDQATGLNVVHDACSQCHQADDCGEQPRLPAAVRDRCVDCHMPLRVKINVNFQTADEDFVPPIRRWEHRIAVHPVARDEVLLGWYRTQTDDASQEKSHQLETQLVEHWLTEAEGSSGEYGSLAAVAAIREALLVQDTPELREKLRAAVAVPSEFLAMWSRAQQHVNENEPQLAIDALEALLAKKPDYAIAHGKLGLEYAMVGNLELAAQHLRAVAEHDPNEVYGYAMLGWLAFLDGRYQDSLDEYRKAEELQPYEFKIQLHTGMSLIQMQRTQEAVERFEKALTIEPQHPEAYEYIVRALHDLSRLPEAIRYAYRAAKLSNFQDINILMTLAELCAEADRIDDAIATANHALVLAHQQNSPLAEHIQERLASYRAAVSTER